MNTTNLNRHLIVDNYKLNICEIMRCSREKFHIHLSYTNFVNRLFNDYQHIIDNNLDNKNLNNYIIGQKYLYYDKRIKVSGFDKTSITFLGCLLIKHERNIYKEYRWNEVFCIFAVHNHIPNNYMLIELNDLDKYGNKWIHIK